VCCGHNEQLRSPDTCYVDDDTWVHSEPCGHVTRKTRTGNATARPANAGSASSVADTTAICLPPRTLHTASTPHRQHTISIEADGAHHTVQR
jgi:hypothetical protein